MVPLLLAAGGCALLRPSGPQQLEVHALLDGREERVQIDMQHRRFPSHPPIFAGATDTFAVG